MTYFSYEKTLLGYLENLKNQLMLRPLNLGGIAGSGGGGTGGIGYIGYLPQTKVAYDTSELAASGVPVSGSSLLDNLNHIRYRLRAIESGGVAGLLSIYDEGSLVSDSVSALDFYNGTISIAEPGRLTVIFPTGGGSSSDDVYSEVVSGTTHFNTLRAFTPGTLRVYYNGLRQDQDVTPDGDNHGFTTAFTVSGGDVVICDYGIPGSGTTASGGGGGGNLTAKYLLGQQDATLPNAVVLPHFRSYIDALPWSGSFAKEYDTTDTSDITWSGLSGGSGPVSYDSNVTYPSMLNVINERYDSIAYYSWPNGNVTPFTVMAKIYIEPLIQDTTYHGAGIILTNALETLKLRLQLARSAGGSFSVSAHLYNGIAWSQSFTYSLGAAVDTIYLRIQKIGSAGIMYSYSINGVTWRPLGQGAQNASYNRIGLYFFGSTTVENENRYLVHFLRAT